MNVPRPDPWAAQLKIITQLTLQVTQQKDVVEVREVAVDSARAKLDAAYDERDKLQAALEDEAMYLASLNSDLEFHVQRLRETEPYLSPIYGSCAT